MIRTLGGAHERAGADASAPGPTRVRGGCEPGFQRWRLGAEGPDCSDQGGQGRGGVWDSGRGRGGQWEVELVSAVVEDLAGEEESEDVGELYISFARPVNSIAIGAERSSR